MNIRDLVKFDLARLKSADAAQLKGLVTGRPDIFINIVLIAAALSATMYLFADHRRQTAKLDADMRQMRQKGELVEAYKRTQAEYDVLLKNFPEGIPGDQFVDTISRFAVRHNVQILSFSPATEENNEFFRQISVNINIGSENYGDILQFIKDIEEAPFSIRVKKWIGKMVDKKIRSRSQDIKGNQIEVNLGIESIHLKR